MNLFWDRENKPIEDTLDWARKFEDVAYRIIAVDVDDPDNMTKMVSTIWQGMDMSHNLYVTDDTAMIFETAFLVDGIVVDQFASHSEAGAREMHRMMCIELLGREPRPEDGLLRTIIEEERDAKG